MPGTVDVTEVEFPVVAFARPANTDFEVDYADNALSFPFGVDDGRVEGVSFVERCTVLASEQRAVEFAVDKAAVADGSLTFQTQLQANAVEIDVSRDPSVSVDGRLSQQLLFEASVTDASDDVDCVVAVVGNQLAVFRVDEFHREVVLCGRSDASRVDDQRRGVHDERLNRVAGTGGDRVKRSGFPHGVANGKRTALVEAEVGTKAETRLVVRIDYANAADLNWRGTGSNCTVNLNAIRDVGIASVQVEKLTEQSELVVVLAAATALAAIVAAFAATIATLAVAARFAGTATAIAVDAKAGGRNDARKAWRSELSCSSWSSRRHARKWSDRCKLRLRRVTTEKQGQRGQGKYVASFHGTIPHLVIG